MNQIFFRENVAVRPTINVCKEANKRINQNNMNRRLEK